ncbi:hypothetical protein HOK51_10905 [Candidatus Woesearchaeota archaeon]|jgi:hypothetical protein|nr:hypothetical protein [Candidatus Woesearchaeota archaeon]MBT6520330.1 hypothetical protein [Candidatus Woesearchaeota archaeon]MBT7368283.1 hypothetical protein [Candidatus Woesearchaeota archaeon]
MFGKILGFGDLLSALAIVLLHYDFLITWRIGLLFCAYLIIKGYLFLPDVNSVLDILCGVYMFIMLFGITTPLTWIVVIYVGQKSLFSLVLS